MVHIEFPGFWKYYHLLSEHQLQQSDWLILLWNSPENIVRIIWLLRRISYDTIHMMIQGSKGHVFHACMKKHDFGTRKNMRK